ncbi:MAG: CbtB domain-containing protein [Rhodospirillales bacterium]
MTNKTETQQVSVAALDRAAPAMIAFLFGVFLIWGTGFAQPAELHNAAHDGRHSFAMPCH